MAIKILMIAKHIQILHIQVKLAAIIKSPDPEC